MITGEWSPQNHKPTGGQMNGPVDNRTGLEPTLLPQQNHKTTESQTSGPVDNITGL